MNSSDYWSPASKGTNSGYEGGYLKLIILLTYAGIFIKIPLGVFLFHYRNVDDNKNYDLDIGVIKFSLTSNKKNPISEGINKFIINNWSSSALDIYDYIHQLTLSILHHLYHCTSSPSNIFDWIYNARMREPLNCLLSIEDYNIWNKGRNRGVPLYLERQDINSWALLSWGRVLWRRVQSWSSRFQWKMQSQVAIS